MNQKKKKFNPFLDLRKEENLFESQEKILEAKALKFIKNSDWISAENIYRQLVKNNSNNYIVYANLAAVLQKRNITSEVELLLKRAIYLNPEFGAAYSNLGCFYHSQKQFNEAIKFYNKALNISPKHPEANFSIGNAYRDIGDMDNAISHLKKAVLYKDDYYDAYLSLSQIQIKKGKIIESLSHLKKIVEAKNINPNLVLKAGRVYLELELFDDAISVFSDLIKKNSNQLEAKIELISAKKQICCWDNYETDHRELKRLCQSQSNKESSILMYFDDNQEIQFYLAKSYSHERFNNIKDDFKNYQKSLKKRKIKIGYISADFRDHPVTKLLFRIIQLHDSEKYEVNAYSLFDEIEDKYTNEVKKGVNNFLNLSRKSEDEIVEIIRADNLDIAIDLMGYSKNSRPKIFAKRIAPIQISYLGYPGTTCSSFIDYIIADEILIPKKDLKFFSEKVIYLNQSALCCDDRLMFLEKENLREKYGLPKNGFIFACFNNNLKICPKVFKIWMQILQEVDNSFLCLYPSNEKSKINLIEEAELQNISRERLLFLEYLPIEEHIKRHSQCDLFLDTFNFSAGATAVFSILSGTPILTLCGNAFHSRMSASLLSSLDLEELITYSSENYLNIAIELAKNKSKYNLIKEKLVNNLMSNKYFKSELFTRELEKKLKNLLT